MRAKLAFIGIALGGLALVPRSAVAQPDVPLPPGTRVETDLGYANDHEKQALDLYWLPDAEAPTPLVVCIHGGGWRQGRKESCRRSARPLLERGYAVAAVNYRLSPYQ